MSYSACIALGQTVMLNISNPARLALGINREDRRFLKLGNSDTQDHDEQRIVLQYISCQKELIDV